MNAQIMDINMGAVVIAAAANYLLGTIWFSPFLFGKGFLSNVNFREKDRRNCIRLSELSVSAFLFSLITAFVLALLLLVTDSHGAAVGSLLGLIASLGYVVTSIATDHMLEGKTIRMFAVTAGFHTLTFVAMGAVLGAWR